MKERYNEFCQSVYVPIFSKPWWMDAICGRANWNVYVVEKGGIPIAAMPYFFEIKDNKKIITKAKLTQNNGIIIRYPKNQRYSAKLDFEEKIINEVCVYIESLGLSKYEQQYHYKFDNWLPFFWRYYKEITRYTYVIEETSDMIQIEKNYTADARNMLRKAKKSVHVIESDDLDIFYNINELTFKRQNKPIPFSKDLIKRLYESCKKENSGKLLFAVDDENNVHSAALIVWDEQSVYYLINGTDPKFKSSQANTLLIHESINIASKLGKKFDFEGSVIKPIEKAFRQFGGKRKPYFRIYKEFDNLI